MRFLRFRRGSGRAALLSCFALVLLSLGAVSPAAAGTPLVEKHPIKPSPMANQTIPGSPISFVMRDSGSGAVYYNGVGQFFSDNAEGVYVSVNGVVYGPTDVPFGPMVNAYTPVSNVLTGLGTAQSPWRINTVLNLGNTGLQLIRSVRYKNGDLFTRQDMEIKNTASRAYTINLFHAADLQTSSDGMGYGYYDAGSGAVGGYNQARSFFQAFVPITPGSRYQEDVWNTIWGAIGSTTGPGIGFVNSYHPDTYEDNGAGLQWAYLLQPGARINVSDFHSFTASVGCSISFWDVFPEDFYFDPVYYMACNSIVSGYADNTFRPGNYTTRGQLSKIMVTAEGWIIDTSGGPHFRDVPTTDPFYQYIETAYHHNIISGYADGSFRPNLYVTRGQLCKIIVSAEGWAINTTGGPHFVDVPTTYTFYPWIETAYNHNIISGYAGAQFRPGNNATRGQISKIVYNAITAP